MRLSVAVIVVLPVLCHRSCRPWQTPCREAKFCICATATATTDSVERRAGEWKQNRHKTLVQRRSDIWPPVGMCIRSTWLRNMTCELVFYKGFIECIDEYESSPKDENEYIALLFPSSVFAHELYNECNGIYLFFTVMFAFYTVRLPSDP